MSSTQFRLGLPAYMDQVASSEIQEVALSSRGIDTDLCRMLAGALSRAQSGPRVVDLNDNGVNDDGLELIVDALRNNKNVLELHLMNNMITDRGAEFLLRMLQDGSNIRTIAISGNKVADNLVKDIEEVAIINTQPVGFRKVAAYLRANDPRGEVLEVYDDSNFSMSLFKSALANNTHLKVLRLVGCALADGGCGSLSEILPGREGLEVLDLSRNGITSHGLRPVIDALAKNNSIKVLMLNGNRLTDEATRAMCEMLKVNNSIVSVEVTDNAISETAHSKLKHAVSLNSEPLELKQGYYAAQINDPSVSAFNFQWVGDTSRGATVLAPVLRTNTTVTTLNLSNSRMGDAGLRALLPVLEKNATLEVLELANCNITSAGIADLTKVLESGRNSTLRELNFANNKICNRGGKALANALLVSYSVKIINLELNELSPELMDEVEGLLAINREPRALKPIVPRAENNSERLEKIDLSAYDGVQYHTSETARILSLALRGNTFCKSLNLSNQPIGEDGGCYIAQLIAANTALEEIILEDCAIGDRGGCAIAEALASNTRLVHLDLRNNSIGNTSGEALLVNLGEPNDTCTTVNVTKTRIIPEVRECIEAAAALNTQPGQLKRILPQLENQSPVRHRVKNLPPSPKKKGDDAAGAGADSGAVAKPFREISFRREDPNAKALTDVAVQMLCTQLSEDSTVESLDLSGNALTNDAMVHLSAWLARPQTKVTYLSLSYNPTLKDEGIITLARGVAKNNSLKEMDLRQTGFTAKGLEALVQALKTNDTVAAIDYDESPDMSKLLKTEFVRELALNTQNLEVKRLVERIIANDASVTVLDLGDKNIGDLSVKLLSLALVHNTNIVAVNLAGNGISSAGIDFLGDLLEDNKYIRTCSLARNNIDDRGAAFFIRVLNQNHTLKELDVSENPISDALVEELGYMIRVNSGPAGFKKTMGALVSNHPSLKTYDGCGKKEVNKYDDDSTHVLCSLLVDNTVVSKLDLSHNNIGDRGAQLLSDTLRVNRTITSVDLSYNQITAAGVEAIYNALKSNTTLVDVNLEGNPVPKSVVEVLDGPLNVNRTPLRVPKRDKGKFKERPPVTEMGDEQFKDLDYIRDVDDQVLEDGMCMCPPKEKIQEVFLLTDKMNNLLKMHGERNEVKSLTWNKEKGENYQKREKEYAESVSPMRRMLDEQRKLQSQDPIDDEL